MDQSQARRQKILKLLETTNKALSPKEVFQRLAEELSVSQLTVKRDLSSLMVAGVITRQGQGRSTKYQIIDTYKIITRINTEEYFKKEMDQRQALERFQFDIFETISKAVIFSKSELSNFLKLEKEFRQQKSKLSKTQIKREFERLTIELSWKSSEIEGNTYSLLETESLLRDGILAKGKTAEDAKMLINHKKTLDFIRAESKYFEKLNIKKIETLHSYLIEGLDVEKAIRKSLVSITGTKYRPLDNEFQIKEALDAACKIINSKQNIYEKAFWAILLISYIQPFEDGNKRTARMLSTAHLLCGDGIPLSYRAVDSQLFKKAILLFYEQNNVSAFKDIFLEQVDFSVKNYFRASLPEK